jgi:hypothetical protein
MEPKSNLKHKKTGGFIMAEQHVLTWENCLRVIKDNLPIQAFKTWFEPIKPVKSNPAKQSFVIEIDPTMNDLSEFGAYDKMEFQIADEEKNYKPEDSKIQWNSVDVKKSKKLKGKYIVTFTRGDITKSYITDPVFSDDEFKKAMKNYEKDIVAKKLKIKKEEEEKLAIQEKNNLLLKQNNINFNIHRGFMMNNFGLWNCDIPFFTEDYKLTKVKTKEKELNNAKFSLIYEEFNSVYSQYDLFNQNVATIKNIPNTNEILYIVNGTKLFYTTIVNDFSDSDVSMKSLDVSNLTFDEVKKILLGEN